MSDQEKDILQKLKSNKKSERKDALETLLHIGLKDNMVKVVAKLFADPDKGIRNAASTLFVLQPHPKVSEHIVPFIFSKEISVRNMAGEVLLKNGENSINALINTLGQGNAENEKFIIDILGWIGNPKPTSQIIEILKTNKDQNVILACVEALGNIKAEESVEYLLEFLKDDDEKILTPTVMDALGKIGNKEVINHFMKIYNEQDVLTKYTIIESLGRVGDEESLGFLLYELQHTEASLIGPIVKSSECLLNKLGFDIELNEQLQTIILKTLEDSDENIILAAVKLLYKYNSKKLIKAFIAIYGINDDLDEILKNKFIETHETACALIRKRINSNGENTKHLLLLYKEMNLASNRLGIEPVLERAQMDFINTLSTLIDNPDEEIRMVVTELLFVINPKDALLFANKLIYDDNMWNRLKLIELLSNTNEPKAIEMIKKLINDSEDMVREKAKSSLEKKINKDIANVSIYKY